MGRIRILSGDPGSVNFGLSVVDIIGGRVQPVASMMFQDTVKDMKQASVEIRKFRRIMQNYRDKYKPDYVIMERFQSRGIKGPLIESVSATLGVLPCVFRCPVEFITAATWKNRLNKHVDYKELVKKHRLGSNAKTYEGIKIHQFDSIMIAIWLAAKLHDKEPFEMFNRVSIDAFIESCHDLPKL